jgi:hypothetical protein
MGDFFADQGRTRVFVEAYLEYAADAKPAENADQREKIHLGVENQSDSDFSTAKNADWGIITFPTIFIRFLPFFCFSRSLRLRVMSPP